MSTIGIWGFYFAKNFGDDLTAVVMARTVRDVGARPLVFELDQAIANRWGIDTTSDIDAFARACDVIVIGGGNLLVLEANWHPGPFMPRIEALVDRCEHYGRKIHALSIGGDGAAALPSQLPAAVQRLLWSHAGSDFLPTWEH